MCIEMSLLSRHTGFVYHDAGRARADQSRTIHEGDNPTRSNKYGSGLPTESRVFPRFRWSVGSALQLLNHATGFCATATFDF